MTKKELAWVVTMRDIIARLLISASYSALSQGNIALVPLSTTKNNIFPLVCSCLFMMIAMKTQTLEGLQNVFIMLAGQNVSSGIPLPQEPSGALVLPAIMVYFGAASMIMRYLHNNVSCRTQCMDITSKTMKYFILFATSRALARFQAIKQEEVLGLISLVYLLLPVNVLGINPNDEEEEADDISTAVYFWRIVDCLANRGIAIWIIDKIQVFTGASSLFPNLFFLLAVSMWNPLARVAKLGDCMGVFTFYAAREIVQIMQKKMSEAVCLSFLSCLIICMTMRGDSSSTMMRMVVIGIGMIFSTWLERWVKNWSQTSDWMIIYLIIFVCLEAIGLSLSKREEQIRGSMQQEATDDDKNNNINNDKIMMMDLNKEESGFMYGGIAHEQAMLGLPLVIDSDGAH